jgi:glycosyltransferase involved in cell wall biosynthesis
MRILWIKTELLHPIDKGGKIRTYQMLKAMKVSHHIDYLCLDDGASQAESRESPAEYSHTLTTVSFHPPRKGSFKFLLHLLGNMFSSAPYAIARYRCAALKTHIERMAAQVDVVVCDFLAPAMNVPTNLPVPAVLFEHNVEAEIWIRHAGVPQNPLRRLYMAMQARRMVAYEAAECRRFSRVIAVSGNDADTIRTRYGATAVSHVETGVDVEYFAPPGTALRNSQRIVFVGSMDWLPNIDGITWFMQQVLPIIRTALPNVLLQVVGRSPPRSLYQLAEQSGNIEITGSVPDVRPYLWHAALSIVPLRIGGGTRLKIYEAMAAGIPVVSTTIGAEGLPVKRGEHIELADSPAAFAASVINLISDEAKATTISDMAQQFVKENCAWNIVAEDFVAKCAGGIGL